MLKKDTLKMVHSLKPRVVDLYISNVFVGYVTQKLDGLIIIKIYDILKFINGYYMQLI